MAGGAALDVGSLQDLQAKAGLVPDREVTAREHMLYVLEPTPVLSAADGQALWRAVQE